MVRFSGRSDAPKTSVQNSPLSNSPVASGSGNIQTPIQIHTARDVHIGPAPPAIPISQPEPAPETRQRPLPNIVLAGAHTVGVSQVSQGVWSDTYPVQNAFIVEFTNEARIGRQNVGGLVKAQLSFSNGAKELRRITGCWLNQRYRYD